MARKTASRLQRRREVEAAGAVSRAKPEGKKPAKKRTTRRKTKAPDRKRLFWGVFSGTLKEEARFNYDQLKQAEERLELLRSKSKKTYFIQPIKEVITDDQVSAAPESDEEAEEIIDAEVESDEEEDEDEEESEEEEPDEE